MFDHFLTCTPEIAPVNSPQEFLAFCGVVGLGKTQAEQALCLPMGECKYDIERNAAAT